MTSTNPTAAPALPVVRDLTPRPGQSSEDIKSWFEARAKASPSDIPRLARLYYGELRKTCPAKDLTDPDEDRAYQEWHATLTPEQLKVADLAKAQKDADPTVQAARKKAAERAKQAPEYQQALAKKRADYADQKGGDVRPYRKGEAALTKKERVERSRAFLRGELAAGRNPYPADKYGAAEVKQATLDSHMTRHLVCEHLLEHGDLDLDSAEASGLIEQVHAVTSTEPIGENKAAARKLIAGAIETLRCAGAIRRSDGVWRLHRDASADLEAMKDIPGFGIF